MNNSAAKVGEIFREAGTAFNKLSEMTLMLQPMDDSPGGKWSDAEVEMLRGCINRFAVELNKISQHIKNRTMRHLKYLLVKSSGTIQDNSSSPPQPLTQQPQLLPQETQLLPQEPQLLPQQPQLLPQQPQVTPQQPQLLPQQPQLWSQQPQQPQLLQPQLLLQQLHPSPQQPHPAQQINTLETESQFDFNGVLVNMFSQGFPDNDDKDEDFNSFLLHFDPNEVNSTPPANIMQEDRIRQQPSSEFEDLQDSSYDKTLQAVPSLISLLDADVNNATPYSEINNLADSCMANIGTLHAELTNYGRNLDEATGPSNNFQELNYMISREAHFSLRQAQDTWNHVSSPATNHTNPIESEERVTGNFILHSPLSCPKSPYIGVQAPDESTFTENIPLTESQYRPQLDTFKSLLEGSEDALKCIQSEGNPHGKILCPGSFSNYNLNNDPLGVRARSDEQEGSSTKKNIFTNLFGNTLYSANPEPVTSVQEETNYTWIRADTNEQALPSRAHRTRGCRGRRRPRRRTEGPDTRTLADPIISPHDESTADPSQGRMTKSRRRQGCHCDEIENLGKKKAQKEKQSPT